MPFAHLSMREESLVYMVILLVFVGLLYRFVISPELKHLSAARFHLDSQQEVLETRAAEMQRRNMLSDRVQRLKTAIAETKQLLFTRDEAMDFLRLLPQLVNETGSVLVTMDPGRMTDLSSDAAAVQVGKQVSEMEDEEPYARMPIQIGIRGEYSEIVGFFEQLEEREQLITVSEISITTAVDPVEVDARVTLNVYVYEREET